MWPFVEAKSQDDLLDGSRSFDPERFMRRTNAAGRDAARDRLRAAGYGELLDLMAAGLSEMTALEAWQEVRLDRQLEKAVAEEVEPDTEPDEPTSTPTNGARDAAIVARAKTGESYRSIGHDFGLSDPRVSAICRAHGLRRRKSSRRTSAAGDRKKGGAKL